jgi:hypothetical protein
MTAAQPNDLGRLAGTFTDDAAAEGAQREAEPQPEYTGDMPDDPEEARTYRPGEDQPDEATP